MLQSTTCPGNILAMSNHCFNIHSTHCVMIGPNLDFLATGAYYPEFFVNQVEIRQFLIHELQGGIILQPLIPNTLTYAADSPGLDTTGLYYSYRKSKVMIVGHYVTV